MIFLRGLSLLLFLAPLVHPSPAGDSLVESANDVRTVMATSGDIKDCDCDYRRAGRNGCIISQAARPGKACKCSMNFLFTCKGEEVECYDSTSPACKASGDVSLLACLQGGGNCDGYAEQGQACDCDYRADGGGCLLVKNSLPGAACKCVYSGAWTCRGDLAICVNGWNSTYCKSPDLSIHSCLEGGGDCWGHREAKCDCDYHPGGCSISQPPPPNTACRCIYKGAWTCGGQVVKCSDPESQYCKNPDKSKESCFQGRGDCGAY